MSVVFPSCQVCYFRVCTSCLLSNSLYSNLVREDPERGPLVSRLGESSDEGRTTPPVETLDVGETGDDPLPVPVWSPARTTRQTPL